MELNSPLNWTVVKFGESCIFSQGIQVDVNLQSEVKKNNQVRFLRIIDFTQGDDPPRYIDNPGEKYFLEKDEIAMVRYGTVGFVCTGKEGVIANNLFKIIPSEYLAKGYLINFLKSQFFKSKLESKGATMQALNFGLINPIEIPLPPIAEQMRIVAKIEELFSELDKGIETLKTAQQQLKVYRQAVLKYAFEGRLTNPDVKEGELPEGWIAKTISELGKVKGGKRLPKGHDYSDSKTKYPYLRVTDFKNLSIDKKRLKYLKEDTHLAIKNYTISKDDVYISIAGSIGFVGTIPIDLDGANLTENAAKITGLTEISNIYLALYLSSGFAQEQISEHTIATTQPKLSLFRIEKIKVTYPISKIDQSSIIQEIESRLSVCYKIEESIEQGLQQAEALRQSILKKAFEGRLVPQDPNDEPASVLLERIKGERQKAQQEKKIKTKKVKA